FNGLMHEKAKEDDCGARGCEVVLAEKLILPWAGLVDLEIASETKGALHRQAVFEHKTLGREQVLLDVRPLRQDLPDRCEMPPGPSMGGEHEKFFGAWESDVVQSHKGE